VKRCFKPFVCVFENFEKSGLLQMVFSKNGFMKTCFQSLLKMLYCKRFWFTKSKTNFKREFIFKWKPFQVASISCKKKSNFVSKRKLIRKCVASKTLA
jgi:hypothetical protein